MDSSTSNELRNSLTDLVNTYRETYRRAMLIELPYITFKQLVYLDTILRLKKPTYGEIAEKFGVSKPTVTAIVNKLISLGYVKREQSQVDHRIHHLIVSSKGRKLVEIEMHTAMEFVKNMQRCLTQAEQEQFIAIVHKILANSPSKMG